MLGLGLSESLPTSLIGSNRSGVVLRWLIQLAGETTDQTELCRIKNTDCQLPSYIHEKQQQKIAATVDEIDAMCVSVRLCVNVCDIIIKHRCDVV